MSQHAQLVQRAVAWLRNRQRCPVVLAEISTAATVYPDAIGWRRGYSLLVECKVSRGDFHADRKKLIHRLPDSAPGIERWYLTPPGLVGAHELPPGWGLAEAHRKRVQVVVQATPEHSVGRYRQDALILSSALRRHQLGVEWHNDEARFAAFGTLQPQE